MIERRKPPFGIAPPAGHVDDHGSFEDAAKVELKEEVGLDLLGLELIIEGRRNNPCRRIDGTWHYWKIYKASVAGKVSLSKSETKNSSWVSMLLMKQLSERTKEYLTGKVSEAEWRGSPGLEPVWNDWFAEIGLIERP